MKSYLDRLDMLTRKHTAFNTFLDFCAADYTPTLLPNHHEKIELADAYDSFNYPTGKQAYRGSDGPGYSLIRDAFELSSGKPDHVVRVSSDPAYREQWTQNKINDICRFLKNDCNRFIGCAKSINARLNLTDTDFDYFGWYESARFIAECIWNDREIPELGE